MFKIDEEDKIKNSRNIEYIREFLSQLGIPIEIRQHPRYVSILWKISHIITEANVEAYSPEALVLLETICKLNKGKLKIIEGVAESGWTPSSVYYFDNEDRKLRRTKERLNRSGEVVTQISTYDENGIEEMTFCVDSNGEDEIHYTKVTRLPERIEMILIERILEIDGERQVLENTYQTRRLITALEDINPSYDELDPYNKMDYRTNGRPDIYRDLTPSEQETLSENEGEIKPLSDEEKTAQLKNYKKTNQIFGRTTSFEEAVERYLLGNDRGHI